jgi:hypothetical protein
MKKLAICIFIISSALSISAQETTPPIEKRVGLSEAAVALDATGATALEATLGTTGLNGTPENPVTNVRVVIRNSSPIALAFASGVVTFYDSQGVRCGEGVFKTDVLAPGESFDTDSPGVRIRCTPNSWRIVATSLVPRVPPTISTTLISKPLANLVINIDGDTHPIQLGKPMTIKLGDKQRTIVIREAR